MRRPNCSGTARPFVQLASLALQTSYRTYIGPGGEEPTLAHLEGHNNSDLAATFVD